MNHFESISNLKWIYYKLNQEKFMFTSGRISVSGIDLDEASISKRCD